MARGDHKKKLEAKRGKKGSDIDRFVAKCVANDKLARLYGPAPMSLRVDFEHTDIHGMPLDNEAWMYDSRTGETVPLNRAAKRAKEEACQSKN